MQDNFLKIVGSSYGLEWTHISGLESTRRSPLRGKTWMREREREKEKKDRLLDSLILGCLARASSPFLFFHGVHSIPELPESSSSVTVSMSAKLPKSQCRLIF